MPSHHSSSSHSSSSHSSSSHSSHSSRSFSSSSRSSGSGGSYSRGPSGHSSTSRTSRPLSGGLFGSSGSANVRAGRARTNQPTGYTPTGNTTDRPRYVYGRRHDYIYYPVSWIDSATGKSYEKGYYDENGKRYEDVSFAKDGKYENVLCHCPYCDQDAVMNLSTEDAETKKLQCPSCGAPIEIVSELDTALQGVSGQGAIPEQAPQTENTVKNRHGCLITAVIVLFLVILTSVAGSLYDQTSDVVSTINGQAGAGNAANYNDSDTLYLVRTGIESFRIADEGEAASKALTWDKEADSFRDQDAEYWVWYNTELDPPQWQYWREGISSDFGDYGWMEHDESGWYIEVSDGNWIEVPSKYDLSGLWYFD